MRLYIKVIPEREWFNHSLVLENNGLEVSLDFEETYTRDPYNIPMSMITFGQNIAKVLGIEF